MTDNGQCADVPLAPNVEEDEGHGRIEIESDEEMRSYSLRFIAAVGFVWCILDKM